MHLFVKDAKALACVRTLKFSVAQIRWDVLGGEAEVSRVGAEKDHGEELGFYHTSLKEGNVLLRFALRQLAQQQVKYHLEAG